MNVPAKTTKKTDRREALVLKRRESNDKTYFMLCVNGSVPEGALVWLESHVAKTAAQNKFFHALVGDIARFTGETPGEVKTRYKTAAEVGWSDGSETHEWRRATKDEAQGAITLLLDDVKMNDIPLGKSSMVHIEAKSRIEICKYNKRCLLCGDSADEHHAKKTVGANGGRKHSDGLPTVPLCRVHHSEIHSTGPIAFIAKYVLFDFEIYLMPYSADA